jgi:transcriptional regulator with XRE-family HTH domain
MVNLTSFGGPGRVCTVTTRDLTPRYIQLVNELGDEMGRTRGWRRRAADRLGIDESTLSRILKGTRSVGWDLAERAIERLDIEREFFTSERAPGRAIRPLRRGQRHRKGTLLADLIDKFESGTATVADVYELARAVEDSPPVHSARVILKTPAPKSEQQIGALFIAATRLIEQLRTQVSETKNVRPNA